MSDTEHDAQAPVVGGRLGRYRLLEELGAGGMGVVYRAYDEELDRLVALKIVRELESTRQEARDRLLREGRAIARLHHPHVVKVHEVGMSEDRLFLAMELVAGPSLGQWLAQRPRSWREVLPMLIDAGEGLAAAHDAGLVHRDFKPANVLVDAARTDAMHPRVRVADFGLARSASSWGGEMPSVSASGTALPGVTERGAVVGTPAYMAPEQHLGEPPGPRADQFAFCVTLWEAIHGTRPFAGSNRQELMANAAHGVFTPPRQRVPRWLRAVLQRGLRAEPRRRYPSMHELLRELRRGPVVALFRRVALVSVAAIGLAALLGYRDTLEQRRQCAREAATMVSGWDGHDHADPAARTIAGALEEHARALELVARETCEARRLHGEEPAEATDQCLADRAADLQAWAARLDVADTDAIGRAVDALPLLGSPARCRHADPIAAPATRPDALARARASLAFGRPDEAVRELEAMPLDHAEASLLRGLAAATQGRPEEARAAVWEAIWSAEASSQDLLGAQAWVEQVRVSSSQADMERLARLAEFAIERAGGDEELALSLALLQAERATAQGRSADAVAMLDAAPAPAKLRVHDLLHARALRLRGQALLALHRDDEAASELVRALALTGDLYGPEHPRVAECERALATVLH